MGDVYDAHKALADQVTSGLIPLSEGLPGDPGFDQPDEFDVVTGPVETKGPETPVVKVADAKRPEAKRGRYSLPNPENGKSKSWQRVTRFVGQFEDQYHLELWKQRNVIKGTAMLAEAGRVSTSDLAKRDVKLDRERLNNIADAAQDVAEAYKMADEGTALHKSTELADYAGGDLNRVPEHHRAKVRMYLDALATHGITVVPDMIERVTVSAKYGCAGKFDRIYRLCEGSYVIGDLKTGDSLDLSFPHIAAQLEAYENGINTHGIFDGQRYDESIKVRTDFGIVVHLPSTRDEVTIYVVDLDEGRKLNEVNVTIREARRVKAKHVSDVYTPDLNHLNQEEVDFHWLEQLNAAQSLMDLVAVADRARTFGQWNERLADQARLIANDMRRSAAGMGS